jgi:hypothetical protein
VFLIDLCYYEYKSRGVDFGVRALAKIGQFFLRGRGRSTLRSDVQGAGLERGAIGVL